MDHTAPSAMAPARLSRNILPVILPGLQNPVGCVNQLVSQRFLCSLCLSIPLTGTLYSPLTCQMPARLSTCSASGALGWLTQRLAPLSSPVMKPSPLCPACCSSTLLLCKCSEAEISSNSALGTQQVLHKHLWSDLTE